MGDLGIPQDIIDGVDDVMVEVGSTFTITIIEYGAVDPDNPGAAPSETPTVIEFEGFLYDIEDNKIDGSTVLRGDQNLLIAVSTLSVAEVGQITPGNYIIRGAESFNIIASEPIKVSGITTVVIAQVRN